MAESESGADKSEEPTSKRLEESRKKGQIARSRELNTVVVTMAGIGGLLVYGADFGQTLLELMRGNFALSRDVLLDDRSMALYLLASGKMALEAMMPLLVILLIAAIVTPPDVVSQLILFMAIYPLYEVSIWMIARFERDREAQQRADGTWVDEDDE